MAETFEATTDPACGMRVDPATARAHVEFDGATYYFCSRHCADTFSLDPDKFCRHAARRNPFRFRSARQNGRRRSTRTRRETGGWCAARSTSTEWDMTTYTYTVDGMTCGVCVAEVMEGIRLLPGVSGVAVSLVPDGPSPLFIESRVAIAPEVVRETVEMVGFHATGTSKHFARHLRRTFTA